MIHISIYLSLSIYLCLSLSIYLSIYLSIRLHLYVHIQLRLAMSAMTWVAVLLHGGQMSLSGSDGIGLLLAMSVPGFSKWLDKHGDIIYNYAGE